MNKTALTKTYTKDIQNSCLNSKKIVLSLATISFLASCTHATLTPEIKTYEETNRHAKARSGFRSRNTDNTTIDSLRNQQVTITGNNKEHSLTIKETGTLTYEDKAIYVHASNSDTLTLTNLTNNGTINGKIGIENNGNFTGTIAVNTFENTGQINGQIYMGIWGGNSGTLNIDKFDNSGTIIDNNKGVFFEGKNTNIQTFNNSGFISANKGVDIGNIGTIKNFNNNGTIQGSEVGVAINTKIDTFTNNGFINSIGKSEQWSNGVWVSGNTNVKTFVNKGTIQGVTAPIRSLGGTIETLINEGIMNGGSAGIYIRESLVKTLINSGTINHTNASLGWGAGIKLERGGTIENIINTGTINSAGFGISVTYGKFGTLTIRDGGKVYGKYMGIGVNQWQTLGDLYIDGSSSNGTVSGIYSDQYGISLDTGSQTQKIELKNGGIIKGKVHGIRLINSASLSGEMILSGEGSRVEGGRGSGISNDGGKITGSITIKDGATVTATSNQAISNSGSGSITGGITVSGENTKLEGNIINTGNASIGSDIKIEDGAKVEGGLVNQGNGSISGSVQVSGGSSIDSITNEGSGSISGSITVDKGSKLDSITNTSTS
nr:hypothetical protein [Campylobacter jejuni]